MSLAKRILYLPARLLFRRKPIEPPIDATRVRKVLLLRYDAIGDMIVTMPTVDLLRERIPGVEIDIVTSPTNDSVISEDPRIRKRFVFSRKLADLPALAAQLRKERYDVVIPLVMHRTTESGLVANAACGPQGVTLFFDHVNRRDLYSVWFNVQIPTERNVRTMVEMVLNMVSKSFGWKIDPKDYPVRLFLPKGADQYATQQTQWMTGLRIALNLSAKDARRMLTLEQNTTLVRGLLADFPRSTMIITSAPDRYHMARTLTEIDPTRIYAAEPAPTVVGALAITDHVDVVVTPDTSIAHAASGFGTPVIGMYSHITDYLNEWMPWGVPYIDIYADDPLPLDTLDVELVLEAARTFIPANVMQEKV